MVQQQHDGGRQHHQREQEVAHHGHRVQVGEHGDAAERPLGEGADADGQCQEPLVPVAPAHDAPGRDRQQHRDHDDAGRQDAVAVLDHRVRGERRGRPAVAQRPVGTPQAGVRTRTSAPETTFT